MAQVLVSNKVGSVGPSTFQRNRHGLTERVRVTPRNPRTGPQQQQRRLLAAASSAWRGLSDDERAGWRVLGAQLRGNLTGQQTYNKINLVVTTCRQPALTVAPALPGFGVLSCAGLQATSAPRLLLQQVAESSGLEGFLMIEASRPLSAGISYAQDRLRFLTAMVCAGREPADLDLTAVYVARFGEPSVGQRIFVRLSAMKNGFKGPPLDLNVLLAEAA